MKPRRTVAPAALVSLLALAASLAAFQSSPGYHLLRTVPLGAAPGGGEYFDYINFDSASRRVYVSRGTEFTVLNADTGAVIGNIAGLKRDHGVALVPELNRGFITDGDAGEVLVFDLKTLQETGRIKTDQDSDSILYDSVSKRVFAFNGNPNSVTVIDPATAKAVTTIPLGGAPEQAVADGRGMIYNNLEDKNEVIAIDARALKITARWPVAPAGQPVSIAMDRQSRLLFIGARNPAVFIVMNADTGKLVGSPVPIGARVDTSVFDPETKLAACSTGDGTIHVFHEDSADSVSLVQTVKTQYGAKTMALDPKTHNLLVDTADAETPPAGAANARPAFKPGTLHLMIYGR